LLPLILALLLAAILKPIVFFLRKRHWPFSLCVVVVLLLAAGLLWVLSLVIFSGVDAVVRGAPAYQDRMNRLLAAGLEAGDAVLRRFGSNVQDFTRRNSFSLSAVTGFLASGIGTFVDFIGKMVMTILFLVFLLAGSEGFPEKLQRAVSGQRLQQVTQVIAQTNRQVRRYLVTKTLVSIATGGVMTLIMVLFGVDFAVFLGVLAFFLNFIPNVGSFIATVLPAVVSLLQFESVGLSALIAVLMIISQNIIGNFIEPRLMGRTLDLSPLLVLLSLVFWGWLWGLWGMVLAVPITSIIKIVCENVEALQPVAVLMSAGAARKRAPQNKNEFSGNV
jgi:predicted PurR-regulated permease PerM